MNILTRTLNPEEQQIFEKYSNLTHSILHNFDLYEINSELAVNQKSLLISKVICNENDTCDIILHKINKIVREKLYIAFLKNKSFTKKFFIFLFNDSNSQNIINDYRESLNYDDNSVICIFTLRNFIDNVYTKQFINEYIFINNLHSNEAEKKWIQNWFNNDRKLIQYQIINTVIKYWLDRINIQYFDNIEYS